jgi:GNAT superfamily N-acetyltransferase
MTEPGASPYVTTGIEPDDATSGFVCGKRALDDYFARHALPNDQAGIGRAYVMRRSDADGDDVPRVLGFYTLSMASIGSEAAAAALERKLPRYPMPVALVGRLAVDHRVHGRRIGETLLMDALRRVVDVGAFVGCIGVIVDAKDSDAERFYAKYDFVTVDAEAWPRRMFLSIAVARAAFEDGPGAPV